MTNFVTVDGFYEGEGEGRSISAVFEYRHPESSRDDAFDHYNTELLHREVEAFSPHGAHLGALDPFTHRLIKSARRGRKLLDDLGKPDHEKLKLQQSPGGLFSSANNRSNSPAEMAG